MSLTQQLKEAGYEEIAALYEKKNSKVIQPIMEHINKNEKLPYSSLALLVQQLASVGAIDIRTEDIVWADVTATLEEFIFLEKESDFIYQIDERLVTLYVEAVAGDEQQMMELAAQYRLEGYDEQAFEWYKLCASLQIPQAIYWVSNYIYVGEIVETDLQAVFDGYTRAAKMKDPDASNNLADMYLKGEFVEQNDYKAYELFKYAAENGVAESMYTLGYLYGNGRAVDKDEEKSAYWYLQSALHGDLFAINKMGHQAFERNEDEQAFDWYMKAAEKNDIQGEYNVGFCYESGIGVEVNIKKACYWYKRAAIQGDEQSLIRLKELKNG